MHKRKLDSRAEEISATNRAKKPFVEGNSSPKETLDNDTEVIVSVEEMSPELEDLEEEKELEIRDKLLEESSVSLKTRQFVNTNNQDLKLIKCKYNNTFCSYESQTL